MLTCFLIFVGSAVYDEQDGDFLFTRGSKRVKTVAEAPEPEPEPEPQPVARAPARRSVGRPPKSSSNSSKKRTTTPPLPPPLEEKKTKAAVAPARGRPSKRNSVQPPSPPATSQAEEEIGPAHKTRGRRKAKEPPLKTHHEEEAPPPRTNGARAAAKDNPRLKQPREEVEEEGTPIGRDRSMGSDVNSFDSRQIALPFSDTPIINRNKEMRKKGGASGARRSSLGMRGRRASSLIDNGHSAIPHREVDPSEFYKHIEADGLSEPRRMKQLLTWCGERALSEKPPHGTHGSSAVLGGECPVRTLDLHRADVLTLSLFSLETARAIQDQLLKDFGSRGEFSDWFSREDEPAPKRPIILKPNPINIQHDAKIAELEAKIER